MMTKLHHYFLLSSNPWALMASFGACNLFLGAMVFLKFGHWSALALDFMVLSLVSFFWWLVYSKELVFEGFCSDQLNGGIKWAMLLFISSEVFFFFSFFWSYFHFFLAPSNQLGMMWPPLMIEMFDFANVPLINTLVLLTSGITVTASHHMLEVGKLKMSQKMLLVTVSMGILFTALQVLEYSSGFFCLNDGAYGTSFFMLTGFHGLHVLVGTIYLVVSLKQINTNSSSKEDYTSFEMSAWYWHFVDVVWIFLYFFLYFLNS